MNMRDKCSADMRRQRLGEEDHRWSMASRQQELYQFEGPGEGDRGQQSGDWSSRISQSNDKPNKTVCRKMPGMVSNPSYS
jgi:hypothetical protein